MEESKEDFLSRMVKQYGVDRNTFLPKQESVEEKDEVIRGIFFDVIFYQEGSIEYKNLFLIEGRKEKYAGTLLGMMSDVAVHNIDEFINKN